MLRRLREGPDLVVAGKQGHEERPNAHEQKTGDQGRLSTDAIAIVAEDRGANRAGDKADEVYAEGIQGTGERVRLGEEKLCENKRRDRAVQEEIVPFNSSADRTGDDRFHQHSAMVHGFDRINSGRAHR